MFGLLTYYYLVLANSLLRESVLCFCNEVTGMLSVVCFCNRICCFKMGQQIVLSAFGRQTEN